MREESGSSSFFIPSLGANWQIGENSAFGLAIYGNGGMNTSWPNAVYYADIVRNRSHSWSKMLTSSPKSATS